MDILSIIVQILQYLNINEDLYLELKLIFKLNVRKEEKKQ